MSEDKPKITREFIHQNTIILYPKTESEAASIQEFLFSLGVKWNAGQTDVIEVNNCISNGMAINSSKITYGATDDEKRRGIVLTAQELIEGYDPNDIKNLSGDRLVREVFNQLSQQIAELKAENAELKKEIADIKKPKKLDKSNMPKL